MTAFDLLVRGDAAGVGVVDECDRRGDRWRSRAAAREEVDARGLQVLPGVVDAHVHFNEPGRTDWEGFATGTAALAAGGRRRRWTCRSTRPADARRRGVRPEASRGGSAARVDFGLWGGLVPGNLGSLGRARRAGRRRLEGVHVATAGSRTSAAADDRTLYEGMVRAAALGLPWPCMPRAVRSPRAPGPRPDAATRLLDSRPAVAETEAIARALHSPPPRAAGCTWCMCHGPRRRARREARRAARTSPARRARTTSCSTAEDVGADRGRRQVRAAGAPGGGGRRAVGRGSPTGRCR